MNKSDKSNEIGLWLSCFYLLPIFWDDLLIISPKKQDTEDSKSMKISYTEEIDFGSINQEEHCISNTIFKEAVIIKLELTEDNYQNFKLDFEFKNCHFEKGVLFDLYPNFPKRLVRGNLSLSFDGCLIDKHQSNKEKNYIHFEKGLKFEMFFINSIINGFELKECKLRYLYFSKTIFTNWMSIDSTWVDSIELRNTLGQVFFIGSRNWVYTTNITIRYSDDNLMMIDGIVKNAIYDIVKHKQLKKIFQYKTEYQIHDAGILKVIFEKSLGSGFGSIPAALQNREITNREAYFLTDEDIDLLNISIHTKLSPKTQSVSVNNGILRRLSFRGKSNASINIENTKCNAFGISELSFGEIDIYDLKSHKKDSLFEIKNTNLSNVSFNRVRLDSFDTCNFYRTTLERAVFSATEFPENIEALENIHKPDKKGVDYYDELYENYKKIKAALLEQGNHIQALDMHRKMYNAKRKSKNSKLQDKFILSLNQLSNYHGTSISRAFWLSLFLICFFGLIYCLALPNAPYKFGWNGYESFLLAMEESCKFTLNNIKSFFILANPTHKLSSLITVSEAKELSWANYFISLLSRLFIAWGYYQFVSAFRKFGKQL